MTLLGRLLVTPSQRPRPLFRTMPPRTNSGPSWTASVWKWRASELEAQKIADRAVVRDLHYGALIEFQGRSRLPQWMRDVSGALRQFVVSLLQPHRPADMGGSIGAQVSPGEAFAYRLWANMLQSH